jgi:uncharacterized protein (TIGR04255 family)
MPLVRPDNLPDFTNPPVTEVVLSIQFAPPPAYREVYAREVWAIFEKSFPIIEEKPQLPPSFEVFGGPEMPGMKLNFGILSGVVHNRYWFLVPNKTELIQFQQDRFIHNWRKVTDNEYPRFEAVVANFSDALASLD